MQRRCCCCQTCLVVPLNSCRGGQVERWYIWVSYSHCMDLKAPYGTSILIESIEYPWWPRTWKFDKWSITRRERLALQVLEDEAILLISLWNILQFFFQTYIVSLENGGRCSSRSSKSLARRWGQEIKWSYHGQGHAGSMISPLNSRDTECLFEPVYPWSCSSYRNGSILLYLGRHHLEARLGKDRGTIYFRTRNLEPS